MSAAATLPDRYRQRFLPSGNDESRVARGGESRFSIFSDARFFAKTTGKLRENAVDIIPALCFLRNISEQTVICEDLKYSPKYIVFNTFDLQFDSQRDYTNIFRIQLLVLKLENGITACQTYVT